MVPYKNSQRYNKAIKIIHALLVDRCKSKQYNMWLKLNCHYMFSAI